MATIVIQTINAISGEARTLSLILLLLAVVLIMTGSIIAVITFSYARKERASPTDEDIADEQL